MKRLFAIILSVAIMIPMGVLVISAEDIVQKNEVVEAAPSADFISRSAAARECDNSIREHLEAVDDELRRHFSGSYLDSSGDLVILLSCDTSACKEQIIAETGYMDAIFKEGNGSYYDTMAALEAINHRIYTSQETVRTGTADAATVAMMKMYPLPEYDAYTNAITLVLDVAPELLPYIMTPGSAESLTVDRIPQELQPLAEQYVKNVSLLYDKIIGTVPPAISFEIVLGTGYEPGFEDILWVGMDL